jgi:hypothetical protein
MYKQIKIPKYLFRFGTRVSKNYLYFSKSTSMLESIIYGIFAINIGNFFDEFSRV